jgi:hypothetical protein
MTRTTLFSIAGLLLVGLLLLACIAPGLAVRVGLLDELLIWLPPQARYQMIVRVGADAQPWDQRGGHPVAVNVWLHDRDRERWHLVPLVRLPLGGDPLPESQSQYQWPNTSVP